MKLSILQENLAHGITTAGRSASTKASLPILSHLLLTTDQGRLKISATNLEIGAHCWIGAKVEVEGSIAVPARVIQDLVSGMSPGKVELEVVKGNLKLTSVGVEANIAGIEGSEFPAVPSFPKEGSIALPTMELAKAVNDIAYAAANEENRPVLTGILWVIKELQMEMVATDGYRLARRIITLPDKITKEEWRALVPSRALVEVAKIISDLHAKGETPDEVKVALVEGDNQISFSLGQVEITSRLIEGQYPPYESIIPSQEDAVVRGIFAKDSLVQAVRLASVFARDLGSIVKIKISDQGLELSANTAQVGDEKTNLEGEIEGSEVNVAFNSRYLLDVLGHLEPKQVSFEIKSSLSPGVFRAVGDDNLTTLIMPVRVQ